MVGMGKHIKGLQGCYAVAIAIAIIAVTIVVSTRVIAVIVATTVVVVVATHSAAELLQVPR